MAKRFVIIGGGPAGNQAATYAARLGAEVTLVERDIVGGAAHLWDCIPSKAMIATGGALSQINTSEGMGLTNVSASLDFDVMRARIGAIEEKLRSSVSGLLESQGVTMLQGTGRMKGPHEVVVETADGLIELDADVVLLSTGSRPRIPDWAPVDASRVLTTRDAYPPPELPEHLIVVGSGVTGVEFVHMFSSFGCQVTLIVSRQQVLPQKDPEVAAALEDDFIRRGVRLYKGARAIGIDVDDAGDRALRRRSGRHRHRTRCWPSARSRTPSDWASTRPASSPTTATSSSTTTASRRCRTSTPPAICQASCHFRRWPRCRVARSPSTPWACTPGPTGTSTTRRRRRPSSPCPRSPTWAWPRPTPSPSGRKIRVTKVPFSANAKALIENDPRGFVKIISDPATGVVLGGSIVGRNAAELISVIALAVTAGLRVHRHRREPARASRPGRSPG